MNEKSYKKKFEFQEKIIARQSEQIELLKLQIEKLKFECEKKDELINSVAPLKEELSEDVKKYKKLKNEFENLVKELKTMKNIVNQEVYKGRWRLIKFLIK